MALFRECGLDHLGYDSQMPRRLTIAAIVAFLLPAILCARDPREQARIDYLIHDMENSTGVKFIRNGTEYDGAAAAKHLQMKVSYASDRVKTAEDFIKYCASESSMTHQKYRIRLANGTTMDAASYFTWELRKFDEKH